MGTTGFELILDTTIAEDDLLVEAENSDPPPSMLSRPGAVFPPPSSSSWTLYEILQYSWKHGHTSNKKWQKFFRIPNHPGIKIIRELSCIVKTVREQTASRTYICYFFYC